MFTPKAQPILQAAGSQQGGHGHVSIEAETQLGHLCRSETVLLGDKLAEIFLNSGQKFGEMEVMVKQWVTEQETNRVDGGWHTEVSLSQMGWTSSDP